MHEMSLMEELLRVAEAEAFARGGRLEAVVLEVGRLAGVETDALRFAFEALKTGTAAEGAVLEIEEPAGRGWCGACAKAWPLEARYDPCPRCGAAPLALLGGRELRIKALDLVS